MTKKSKKKHKNPSTLGELEAQLKQRDARLKKDPPDNYTTDKRLMFEKNLKRCVSCGHLLSLSDFYVQYNTDGSIKKIWPSCKRCISLKNAQKRARAKVSLKIDSLSTYSQDKFNVVCSICGCSDIQCLTLVITNSKSDVKILSDKDLIRFHKQGLMLKNANIMCYNCAHSH